MIHIIYENINFVLYLYFCTNVVNHLNPKGRKPSRYCFGYNQPSIIFGVIEEEKYSLNKTALLSQIQPTFDQKSPTSTYREPCMSEGKSYILVTSKMFYGIYILF